jgi:cysteate synthase
MLNITGGGEERFRHGRDLYFLKPSLVFDLNPSLDEVEARLSQIFR